MKKVLKMKLKNITYCVVSILFIGCVLEINADVKMPTVFGDNMVLQRDISVPIWGWGDKGETVTVDFGGQKKTAVADENGEWRLRLEPLKVDKTPRQMTISGKNKVVIKNILVGDVWLCSGQSNMQMYVKSVLQANKEIAEAKYPEIRLITVPPVASDFLLDDFKGKWAECSPRNVANFSAVAYFFGRKIFKELGVPIGLISTSWGGSRIEPWIAPDGYRLVPELKVISESVDSWSPTSEKGNKKYVEFLSDLNVWRVKAEKAVAEKRDMPPMPQYPGRMNDRQDPTKMYNSMIHPFIPFALRGMLWYQGESNGGEGLSYFYKMRALIEGWRKLWNQGDFPFYFVQLASWQKSDPNDPSLAKGWWARCREAQRKSLEIPNTGMAVTVDIGDEKDIHPKNKQDVGERLALWALAKDYNKDVVFSGPLYREMKIEGDKIRISFDHVGGGLMIAEKKGLELPQELKNGKIKWIAIQDKKDKKWHWADAVIDGNDIIVSNKNVKDPIAVQYCYTMSPTGPLLYNKEGLPAVPFWTGNIN